MNLVLRLVLAGAFAVAALAKWRDRKEFVRALEEFGAPPRAAGVIGRALPAVELAVAALLIPPPTAGWAAAAAFFLLAAFTAVLGWSLVQGRRPACRCFGRLSAARIGPWDLLRNWTLALAAIWVFFSSQAAASSRPLHLAMTVAGGLALPLACLAAGCLGALTLSLHLERRDLHLRLRRLEEAVRVSAPAADPGAPAIEGLPLSSPAPPFRLVTAEGSDRSLDDLLAPELPLLLLFVDPACGGCQRLLPQVAVWQREERRRLTIAVITRLSRGPNWVAAAGLEPGLLLAQRDWEVAAAFRVQNTPSALLLSPDGRVASSVAQGVEAVATFLANLVALARNREAQAVEA